MKIAMTWSGLGRGLLFAAGMLSGVAAGHSFYVERAVSGSAFFALAALFLFYAMSNLSGTRREGDDGDPFDSEAELRNTLAELAVIVAENALNNAKNIGRTMPCTATELGKLEEDLTQMLTDLRVSAGERQRIAQEFEKLRTRTRQTEGRRALAGNRF